MGKKLKTVTLGVGDDPTLVTCKGHVGKKEFNAACRVEWLGGGSYRQKDLRYVYSAVNPKSGKKFRVCAPTVKGARPYTVADWDL